MIYDYPFIKVAYQDDLVFSEGKSYPAGSLLVSLLNCFREHDKSDSPLINLAHLSQLQYEMEHGRCESIYFENARSTIMSILSYLPASPSFAWLKLEEEQAYINDLFSEKTRLKIRIYLKHKSELSRLRSIDISELRDLRRHSTLCILEKVYQEVLKALEFYQYFDMDMRTAHDLIEKFIQRLPTIPRLDEKHILPSAVEILGEKPIHLTASYVPIYRTSRSKSATVARQMHFDNIMSFILTDFFEGLHHGHYPQRCTICGKLFLMTSARRQIYCDGLSPHSLRGKRLSCRKYAAAIGRKERAESDPVADTYNRRCAAIRTEKSRKTIKPEFAEAAIKLAKEHKLKALQDESYAHKQYELDMTRDKLYADTRERLK